MTDKHPIQLALEELYGEFDYSIRSYSGRGMYGKSCLAIVGNRINLLELGFLIRDNDYDENIDTGELSKYQTDDMGLGTVYYWPKIPFVGEDEKSSED